MKKNRNKVIPNIYKRVFLFVTVGVDVQTSFTPRYFGQSQPGVIKVMYH